MTRPLRTVVVLLAVPCFLGCRTYRIEHRDRPTYYDSLPGANLPSDMTLDDGTVVQWRSRPGPVSRGIRVLEEGFDRLEENPDGSHHLHAMLPEHVLLNLYDCLRTESWELLWREVLAADTRRAYETRGEGLEEFSAFFHEHRREIAATVNRMIRDRHHGLVELVRIDRDRMLYRVRGREAADLLFRSVEIVREESGLKLLMVR